MLLRLDVIVYRIERSQAATARPATEGNEPDLLLYWLPIAPQGNALQGKLMGAFTPGKAFVLPLLVKLRIPHAASILPEVVDTFSCLSALAGVAMQRCDQRL